MQQVRRIATVRLPVRIDELAEDGDAVGRVFGVLHDGGSVAFHCEREDDRDVLASLGRRVRAPVAVLRRRLVKIRQRDVEIVLAVDLIPEEVELGHLRGQLTHVSE